MISIEEILDFVFPSQLQHPLACSRLIILAEYGPLVNGEIMSGPARAHRVNTWEMDGMCMQIEREDLIRVYLHRKSDFGLLSRGMEESIIQQADSNLKKAHGKTILPALSRGEVISLFRNLERNTNELLNFSDVQCVIFKYRDDRIKRYKQVNPPLPVIDFAMNGIKEKNQMRSKGKVKKK
jgi:hypothetical protein